MRGCITGNKINKQPKCQGFCFLCLRAILRIIGGSDKCIGEIGLIGQGFNFNEENLEAIQHMINQHSHIFKSNFRVYSEMGFMI